MESSSLQTQPHNADILSFVSVPVCYQAPEAVLEKVGTLTKDLLTGRCCDTASVDFI